MTTMGGGVQLGRPRTSSQASTEEVVVADGAVVMAIRALRHLTASKGSKDTLTSRGTATLGHR